MVKYEKLLKFLGKKSIRFIILLIFVILLSFILIDISPINPIKSYISNMVVSQEQVAILESYWGVNEPITSKMINWFGNILHGDFGTSLIFRMPVIDVIKERFTASLVLMLSSWIFSGILGFICVKIPNIINFGVNIVLYLIILIFLAYTISTSGKKPQ